MLELRPVNYKIANLRGYFASRTHSVGDRLAIQFDPLVDGCESFCVLLQGVVKFADKGLLFQPLTAGIVWKRVGQSGPEAPPDDQGGIEVRLDYEDGSGLYCRFRAIASAVAVREGPMNEELFDE
jgi:hypothetical protein